MKNLKRPIEHAMDVLKANLDSIAQVPEWAEAMGYPHARAFRRDFVRYSRRLPGQVLVELRFLVTLNCIR